MRLTKKEAIALAEKYQSMPQWTPLVLEGVPTSKNSLRKVVRRGRKTFQVFTDEYQKFKQDVCRQFAIWRQQNPDFEPLKGQRSKLILCIKYELIEPNHLCDLSNRSEALLDALNDLAWEDDAYINLTRHIPKNPEHTADANNPRAIVYLNPYEIARVEYKR